MPANEYHFLTQWRVQGPVDLIYDILLRRDHYPRWWSDVFLEAVSEGATPVGEVGDLVRLHTQGRLPYTLRWTAETTAADRPHRIEIRARGDFEGRGIWTLSQDGPETVAVYDWALRVQKPLIRWLSFLLNPLFSWNHRWAMARGQVGLQAEINRRRETTARREASR
jgi:hypothetical protein